MASVIGEGGDDLVAALRECEQSKRVVEADLRAILDEIDRNRERCYGTRRGRFLAWLLKKVA